MSEDELDSPWKEAIERFFEPFMALLFPEIHAKIDWQGGYEFASSNLAQANPIARQALPLADHVVRVRTWMPECDECWVFIHLLPPPTSEQALLERSLTFNRRILDEFGGPALSVAVLLGRLQDRSSGPFGYTLKGPRESLLFYAVNLLDWDERREELERSSDPIAPLLLARLPAGQEREPPCGEC